MFTRCHQLRQSVTHQSVTNYCQQSPECHHLLPGVTRMSHCTARFPKSIILYCQVSTRVSPCSSKCHQNVTIYCEVSAVCHNLLPVFTRVSLLTVTCHQSVTIYIQVSPVFHHLPARSHLSFTIYYYVTTECHHLLPSVAREPPFSAKCD